MCKGGVSLRLLSKNKQPIWYANYTGKQEITDEYGNNVGEYVLSYSEPVKMMWNVNYVESDSEVQSFGVQAKETIVIIAERTGFSLAQESILWYGIEPVIDKDGQTDTAHNYRVVGIRPSLNYVKIYAKQTSVTKPDELDKPPDEGKNG